MFGGQAELPASPTSQAARKPQTGGVISVGDSLNVGTSPYLKGAKSDAVVGRSSAKTVDALKRLMSDGASTVLFDAGTNDGSAAELARSLQRVRKLAGNATVVVPTVNGPDAAAKNRLIRQLGQQGAVRVVDWAAKSKGLVGSDGIHASAQGYKRRAQMIRDALEG
jgi:lysophospholipase L1-like esterase